MNDWITPPGAIPRLSTAQAKDINDLSNAVNAAFEKFPGYDELTGNAIGYATDTGAVNACAVTLSPAPSAYVAGMQIAFIPAFTNTGAATLNVNSLGTKDITDRSGAALAAGALTAGETAHLVYDGARFRLNSYSVSAGSSFGRFLYPESNGAVGDAATDDQTALDAALSSQTTSGGQVLLSTNYGLAGVLDLPSSTSMLGHGPLQTGLTLTASGARAVVGRAADAQNGVLRDFGIFGGGTADYGLLFADDQSGTPTATDYAFAKDGWRLEGVHVTGCLTAGIVIGSESDGAQIVNCRSAAHTAGSAADALRIEAPSAIIGGEFGGCTGYAVRADQGAALNSITSEQVYSVTGARIRLASKGLIHHDGDSDTSGFAAHGVYVGCLIENVGYAEEGGSIEAADDNIFHPAAITALDGRVTIAMPQKLHVGRGRSLVRALDEGVVEVDTGDVTITGNDNGDDCTPFVVGERVWFLGYDTGNGTQPVASETITGGTSGATATLLYDADSASLVREYPATRGLDSGYWGVGTAAGTLKIVDLSGAFEDGETLTFSGGATAETSGTATLSRLGANHSAKIIIPSGFKVRDNLTDWSTYGHISPRQHEFPVSARGARLIAVDRCESLDGPPGAYQGWQSGGTTYATAALDTNDTITGSSSVKVTGDGSTQTAVRYVEGAEIRLYDWTPGALVMVRAVVMMKSVGTGSQKISPSLSLDVRTTGGASPKEGLSEAGFICNDSEPLDTWFYMAALTRATFQTDRPYLSITPEIALMSDDSANFTIDSEMVIDRVEYWIFDDTATALSEDEGEDGFQRFAAKSDAEAATIDAGTKLIELAGHTTAGDGGGAAYTRVDSEPSHEGKLRSVDRFLSDGTTDATNGGWWALAPAISGVTPAQFGAAGDGVADDRQALLDAFNFGMATGAKIVADPGAVYGISAKIDLGKCNGLRLDFGLSYGETTSSGDPKGEPMARIKALSGFPGSDMLVIGSNTDPVSDQATSALNIEVRNLFLDGGGNAERGFILNRASKAIIDGIMAEQVTGDGLTFDGCWLTDVQHTSARFCGGKGEVWTATARKHANTKARFGHQTSCDGYRLYIETADDFTLAPSQLIFTEYTIEGCSTSGAENVEGFGNTACMKIQGDSGVVVFDNCNFNNGGGSEAPCADIGEDGYSRPVGAKFKDCQFQHDWDGVDRRGAIRVRDNVEYLVLDNPYLASSSVKSRLLDLSRVNTGTASTSGAFNSTIVAIGDLRADATTETEDFTKLTVISYRLSHWLTDDLSQMRSAPVNGSVTPDWKLGVMDPANNDAFETIINLSLSGLGLKNFAGTEVDGSAVDGTLIYWDGTGTAPDGGANGEGFYGRANGAWVFIAG